MKKEAAHKLFGRGGPQVLSPLGVQQADKSAVRTWFSEYFGCVNAAGVPQALPRGLWDIDWVSRCWEIAQAMPGGGVGRQAQPERLSGARDVVTAGNTPVNMGLPAVGKRSSTILYKSGSKLKYLRYYIPHSESSLLGAIKSLGRQLSPCRVDWLAWM